MPGKIQPIRDYREPDGTLVPPHPLGVHGQKLWDRVQTEYGIRDVGGQQILYELCGTADLIQTLVEAIRADGATVQTKFTKRAHPAIRELVQCRALVARLITQLGINVEVVKPVGRPARGFGWMPDA